MENRDRDKLSRNKTSTPAGDVNRNTSSDIGKSQSGTTAEFGQNIGRSETPESEPNRRSGSVTGDRSDSSGMSGSSGRNSGGSMGSEH